MNAPVPRFPIACLCGFVFFIKESQRKRKKFCSTACKYHFYTKAIGFKRVDKTPNLSWFSKGVVPWNKGIRGVCKANSGSARPGERRSPATEFTTETTIGENNALWKGDHVGYHALHGWVRRVLGKPGKCAKCGETKKRIDWANKSKNYIRATTDWIALCSTCHGKYDAGASRGAIKRKFGQCV